MITEPVPVPSQDTPKPRRSRLSARALSDPDAFFTELGDEAAWQVEQLANHVAGEDRPGEGYLDRVARLCTARMIAEEIILPQRARPRARARGGAVNPGAGSGGPWTGLFWIGLIGALALLYILPTLIAVLRRAEGLAMVVILNTIPVAWPAALIAACMMPRRDDR